MSRRARLSRILGPLALLLIIAAAGQVLWNNFERSKEASESVEHTYRVLISSERFLSTIREAESSLRAYVITKDRQYLGPYNVDIAFQGHILDTLDKLTRDNSKQRENLKAIRNLATQRVNLMARGLELADQGLLVPMVGPVKSGEGTRIMGELTKQVGEFEEEEHRLLEMRTNAAAEAVSRTRLMLVLTSVLLVLALFVAREFFQRDIRNREAANEALQRQAELIDFSHDAIITLNPAGVITGWNAGAVEIYGWSSAEAIGRRPGEILKSEDEALLAKIDDALAQTGRWDGQLRQTTKDGRICISDSRYVQVRNRAGEPVGVLKISRDETQRVQAEELSRQVAEQRRLALDAAELGFWDYNVLQDSVVWDERCREIMGLHGLGPASFEQALKMVHPDERETMRGASKRAMLGEGDGRFFHEMRIVLRDGTVRWLATHGRVYFAEVNGVARPVRVIGVNGDITERKRVEEALRESEDKLRVALDTGRIGIFNDVVGENKIIFDERAQQLLGFGSDEVEPVAFFNRLHPDDQAKLQAARNEDLKRKDSDPGEIDYRITLPNGEVRWLIARRRVYFGGEGEAKKAIRVLGVLLDITQQKSAEQKLTEALRNSDQERRRLGAILETMPAGVVLADLDNKLQEGNAQAVQIWRAGNFATLAARLHELRGWRAGSGELVRLEDWPRSRALKGETVNGDIIDIERFDGSRGTVFNAASPVRDGLGNIHGAVGVMVDITEQRQVELALRRSEERLRLASRELERLLEQKNILFQEVQHRVKNNLQIVSSLLSLEAQRFEDGEFRKALNASRDRIRSMALMHEKFYHLDDLARIEFAPYVDELVRYFFSLYVANPGDIGFSSSVDVKLSMGEAIPCGLILQELLSNSVKHAFPEGSGDIAIDFHAHDGHYQLCYRDSGVGLPSRVDLEKPASLGLQLVSDLAEQLQGKLRYEYREGSQFTLTFG